MSDRLALVRGRLVHRVVDGELMILDAARDEYVRGNGSMALLWPLLERGCTLAELAAELRGSYDVDEAGAIDAAEELLADLRARGWIDEP